MKKYLTIMLAGLCLLTTACASKEISNTVSETAEIMTQISTETASVPETEPATEALTETVPLEASSPEAIQGIWKNGNGYQWFQENGSYLVMNYVGTFPEEVGIEMTETDMKLTISGEVQQLTQAGTHVFDTLDGLYDVAGQNYQILIVGNAVYTYTNTGMTYSYNGEMLMLQDTQSPCTVNGDTMQFDGNTFSRTHELDDFLLSQETGGN